MADQQSTTTSTTQSANTNTTDDEEIPPIPRYVWVLFAYIAIMLIAILYVVVFDTSQPVVETGLYKWIVDFVSVLA